MARRKWNKAGAYTVKSGRKTVSFIKDAAGRFRDKASGHFISKASAKLRKAKAAKLSLAVEYPESYSKPLGQYGKPDSNELMHEVTFRVKIPKALRGKKGKAGLMVDAIEKVMREQGHKQLKRRKGEKFDRVRFFAYVEGNAMDIGTRKKVRGGAGIRWQSSLSNVSKEIRDKIQALYEGQSLANDPHKTTGSGRQLMRQGPDTVYITAVYAPNEPIPYKPKNKKGIRYL